MTKGDARKLLRERMEQGARRYARADRSDPFALNRALSHLDSILAVEQFDKHGRPLWYDAKPVTVEYTSSDHASESKLYYKVEYRDVVRP